MLVLSRKKEETIVIGDNIEIKVLSVERNVIKLGITAPKHIRVVRSELIAHETASATTVKPRDLHSLPHSSQPEGQTEVGLGQLTTLIYSSDYMSEVENQLLCVLGS